MYDELRQVASRLMRRERTDHTLSPTAVVHEAVIRLLGDAVFERRRTGATCSRRPRGRCGRCSSTTPGGGPPTGAAGAGGACRSTRWWTTSRAGAGCRRGPRGPRPAGRAERAPGQVMTLRYFGGMTVPEVAAALGVSVVTVERDWRLARAWLSGQLREGRTE